MLFNIIGQAVIGWLLADLMSGIFHWWQDRWPSAANTLIGDYLIAPSRLHHLKPAAFTKETFLYRNYATFLGVSILSSLLFLIFNYSVWWLSMTIGGLITTQVHYLAHSPTKVNRLGRLLQASGIIQSPRHHAGHHRPPHGSRYCILTNVLNPYLDEYQIWSKLERCLANRGISMSLGEH